MTVARLLWMGAGALSLYGVVRAFPLAPCWALFALAAVPAWAIWRQHAEASIFQRRALLAGITREDSRVRRWLWAGRAAAVVHVLTALVWAAVLVGLASTFTPWHWALVAADVVVLALATAWVRARLAHDVQEEQLGIVSRRWPLLLGNAALLTLALMACDFFVGTADTRGLAWHEVAERAFSSRLAQAACPLAGALLGGAAALDQLAWHAAQVLIPGLPNAGIKLAAWAFVLAQAGAAAYAVTRLLLGMATLAERRPADAGSVSTPVPSKVFLVTLSILALAYGLALWHLRDLDTQAWSGRAARAAAWANPCRPDPQALAQVRAGMDARLREAQAEVIAASDARIEAASAELFKDVEGGVDRYLDWYFTVLGEYQRLGAWAMGDFAGLVTRELEKGLFGAPGAFGEKVAAVSAALDAETQSRMATVAGQLQARVREGLHAQPCRLEGLDLAALGSLDRDRLRASASLGMGVAGALVARALGARAAASVAARLAASRASHAAVRAGTGVAARRAGSAGLSAAGAAAACAPGGPLAGLCALAAGVIAWIAFDHAFVKVDEALHRDEMRKELLAALAAERLELAAALQARQRAAIERMGAEIHAGVDRMFIPARQGL